MGNQACAYSSFPRDLVLEIVFLRHRMCVPWGSCSKFWREICGSDCLWKFLYEERWPELASLHEESSASPGESHCLEFDQEKDSIKHLNRPVEDMVEAIIAGQIQHRPVYIECRRRRWTFACFNLSLEAVITTESGNEALHMLEIGVNHEGVEVRVSSSRPVGSVMICCDSKSTLYIGT